MNAVSKSLRALAAYQRDNSGFGFVVSHPQNLPQLEIDARAVEVREIATQLDALALEAEGRSITYDEFDALRSRFHPLGKLPPGVLVHDVARAITAAEVARLDQLGC